MGLVSLLVKIIPPKILRGIQEQVVQSKLLIKMMFKLVNEDFMLAVSKKLAYYTFKTASRRVPGYRKFLEKHNINPSKIKNFKDFMEKVPITDKKTYLLEYPLDELCYDGNPHHKGVVNRSSGYTGNPIYFMMKEKENYLEEKCIGYWISTQFGLSPKDLFVNCLLLGSWAGGIRSGNAARYAGMVINVGPRVTEATEVIMDLGKYYERVIILAYPPFVLTLIAELQNKGYDFKKKPMLFFTGGEGYDEAFREDIIRRTEGVGRIYGAYGSIETGVRVANETEETILLRQMVLKNPELCEKLFGKAYPPNLFQYDPTYVHAFTKTDENGKQQLIYTTLTDKLIPMIKYNLKDEGGIYTQKELNALLKKYVNFEIKFRLPMPIMYVYGRADGTLSFIGSNIYPQQIKAALAPYAEYIDDYKAEVTTSEALIYYLLVHILVKDKKKVSAAEIEESLFQSLNTRYFPYEELILNGLADRPVVRLYTENEWPFKRYDPITDAKQKPF